MIKKILVTLLILILIISIGIVSLIVFVDPNNFRGFITDTVKDKTGYELTIEGNLRWHIWPQVSILTDSVKLSDQDAKKPILTADNMRLDVELFPLFSKKLTVKNVFIKSAIINITDESKGLVFDNKEANKPNTSNGEISQTKQAAKPSNWAFTLNKLEVTDSTVVIQHKDDLINFRNINLAIEQKSDKKMTIDVKGNVDRNQQDLYYAANADVDLTQYPNSAIIDLKKFEYSYKGITSSFKALKGNINGLFNYQQTNPMQLSSKNLSFSINENNFNGAFTANLDNKPDIDLQLSSDKLNLSTFLTNDKKVNDNITIQQTPPVVSNIEKIENELNFLNSFNAKLKLNLKQLDANNIILNNINVNMVNNDGVATFHDINFDFAKGHVMATGIANGKQKNTLIKLSPKISNVDLNTFFTQIETPNDLQGSFNANGDLEANTLIGNRLLESIKGNVAINVTNARLNNININNIIQTAAAKYTKDISNPENQKNYTEFSNITANGYLSNGNLELTTLGANSQTLDVTSGSGRVGMTQKDLDVNLNIKLLGGWNGKNDTIAKLQKLTIPLHIYGQFANLHYQIDLEQVIKDLFSDKLQDKLDKLRNKLEGRNSKDDSKSNSKQKAVDLLEGLLTK
ncbi:outer membrane assembly protein AsmA [Gilliamella sp. B3464]|uniref:outer membrane assembly protein AsmA n=1 Tax=unclassified Gilliamella TaxID=2685620 RepID=UPI00226A20A6|nr:MULTISPECIES: outer membrane assembly protein AsmA [unclassified Gilliamella]MCX8711098.1 outer membrane assembly protein AsmA [Gilliamella sp. B3468]MCX8737955.1 outer membrane assembly protein AsmA [Gilliamella sp. B2824]MCX8750148.1 outer membrane assembly protein AsmA [Gilliamella sp. B3464]